MRAPRQLSWLAPTADQSRLCAHCAVKHCGLSHNRTQFPVISQCPTTPALFPSKDLANLAQHRVRQAVVSRKESLRSGLMGGLCHESDDRLSGRSLCWPFWLGEGKHRRLWRFSVWRDYLFLKGQIVCWPWVRDVQTGSVCVSFSGPLSAVCLRLGGVEGLCCRCLIRWMKWCL